LDDRLRRPFYRSPLPPKSGQPLKAWREKTGCGLLLNTSFNCQEPLVNTVDEARAT
jgi:predicted NodU family carbamoyl transferase